MARRRRVFSSSFKAKLPLEAVRGELTVAQIARKHAVHVTQVSAWKQQLLESVCDQFEDGRKRQAEQSADEQELFEQIGRLKMEVEWLKKSCPTRVRSCDDGSNQIIPR